MNLLLIAAAAGIYFFSKNKGKDNKAALAKKYSSMPDAVKATATKATLNPNLKNLIQQKLQQNKIKAMDEQIKADRYVETDEEKAEAKRQQEQKAKDNAARNAALVEANRQRQLERLKELELKNQQFNNQPKTTEQIKIEEVMTSKGIERDKYGRVVLPKPKK